MKPTEQRIDDRLSELDGQDTTAKHSRRSPSSLRVVPSGEIGSEVDLPFEFLTELDAAKYFAVEYRDRVRFCERAGGWRIWDGKRWKLDDDGAINRLAVDLTGKIAELSLSPNLSDKQIEGVFRFAMALRRRRGLDNMVALARHRPEIAIGNPEAFDSHAWLLNLENGTLDLRTGELRPHNPDELLTKLIELPFDPQARCDRFERFLDEVFDGDADTIRFVQQAIGYSMTGDTREHAFLVLYGTGKNGKSTFLRIAGSILGDYAMTARAETFVNRKPGTATNDLARLQGARFVSAVETSDGHLLAESFIKGVTGGDRVSARFLFAEYFEFEPIFKLWLGTNHKPVIRGSDDGIWRRVRLVPFNQRFEDDRADPDLRDKLESELAGILAWAVRGCLDWARNGLSSPETVKAATAAYRSEMDGLAEFLEERCIVAVDARERPSALYTAYRSWAEANGDKPATKKAFGLMLGERGFQPARTRAKRYWVGLRLRGQEHDESDASDNEEIDALLARGREILGDGDAL